MFKFFKADPKSEAEEKLEELIQILFPALKLMTDKNGNKFHVDYGVDTNLEAALMDLEDGHNDRTCQNTIRKCTDRIIKVRQLLEAYREIDKEAKYFIADDLEDDIDEKVQAADREY